MSDLEPVRQEAIRLLCRAHADERLSAEAFEGRLEQIKHAPNQATLAAIVADLEEAGVPTLAHSGNYHLTRTEQFGVAAADHTAAPVSPAEYLRISSVFGSASRAGSWTVPLAIDGMVLFGELTLDLRDAVFGSDVVDINVDVKLGSFTLIVPAGTQLENEMHETLSSSTHSTRSARGARPNGLLVRLRGQALLASVEVKEKFPSKNLKGEGGFFQRLLGSGD